MWVPKSTKALKCVVAADEGIKLALPLLSTISLFNPFPNKPLARSFDLVMRRRLPSPRPATDPLRVSHFVGRAAADDLDGTAGLKPEPRSPSLDSMPSSVCDGDHPSDSVGLVEIRALELKPCIYSTSSLHHYHSYEQCPTRSDLTNRENALRRRGRLLPGCAVDELHVGGFPVGFPTQSGSDRSHEA